MSTIYFSIGPARQRYGRTSPGSALRKVFDGPGWLGQNPRGLLRRIEMREIASLRRPSITDVVQITRPRRRQCTRHRTAGRLDAPVPRPLHGGHRGERVVAIYRRQPQAVLAYRAGLMTPSGP